MQDNSYNNQIVNKIKDYKRGKIIFPADFLKIAPPTAIRKTLSRLAKDEFLVRLSEGIYLFPKMDPELGILYPSMEEVATSIAKKERIKILPTGAWALNKLGLSTQVPTKVVYLTDGEKKQLRLGRNSITFKSTTPKKLAAKGKYSSLVIQALQELGKKNIDERTTKKLATVLKQEKPETIWLDAKTAPAWIAEILFNIAKTPFNE